jgi:hypothetical protein
MHSYDEMSNDDAPSHLRAEWFPISLHSAYIQFQNVAQKSLQKNVKSDQPGHLGSILHQKLTKPFRTKIFFDFQPLQTPFSLIVALSGPNRLTAEPLNRRTTEPPNRRKTDQPNNRTAEPPKTQTTEPPNRQSPNRRTAEPPSRWTAELPNSRTAEPPNSRTAEQQNNRNPCTSTLADVAKHLTRPFASSLQEKRVQVFLRYYTRKLAQTTATTTRPWKHKKREVYICYVVCIYIYIYIYFFFIYILHHNIYIYVYIYICMLYLWDINT